MTSQAGHAQWAGRAAAGWDALLETSVRGVPAEVRDAPAATRSRGGLRVIEPRKRRRIAAWPLSQVLWASTVLELSGRSRGVGPELLWSALDWYRSGDAYLDNRPLGKRYYDDNAWLGLIAAQQGRLRGRHLRESPRGREESEVDRELAPWHARAQRMAAFTSTAWRPTPRGSGVLWVEGGDTLNACSTGGTGLLAWAVSVQGTESATVATLRARQAVAARDFLNGPLMRDDGLVADHLRADGTVEPSVWLYNQGLLLALYDRLQDDGARSKEATALIRAVRAGFSPAQVQTQPTVFACIWWRALLGNRARVGADDVPEVREYLESVWARGRDGDGFFIGFGRYDDGKVIDHAALVGLMAAYALGPAWWAELL